MSENSQDVTIDNQQERLSEAELGWIAGIIDGEGSITINVNSTHRSVYPRIWISSSDKEIINKSADILGKIKVKFSSKWKQPKGNRRPHGYIVVITVKRVKKVLELLTPYLTAKLPHARYLIEFCKIRMSLPYGHSYTKRELELKNLVGHIQIKGGKKTSDGIPNDYTPSVRPRYRMKI